MKTCSLPFLLLCLATVIVYHLIPGKRPRQILLGLVNIGFLVPLVPNWQSAAWLVGLMAGTYMVLRLVRASPRGVFVWGAIGLAAALFMFLKRHPYVPRILPVELFWHWWWSVWQQPTAVVGLSYMLFKFIHMLVDEWQGQLAQFSLWSYLNYQLSFFTLVAGPIQRYNDFRRYWEEMDLGPSDARDTLLAWNRLLLGLLKMAILAELARNAFINARGRLELPGYSQLSLFAVYFYAYPAYLYFNFSGYTDAMIGAAGLLGFKLPENFNRPYLSRNVLDFWNRWHITLSHWIRDYIFMASYKQAASAFPRWSRLWSYPLLFVALFAAGIWHGATSAYVSFGVLNGLGAVVNQVYGDVLKLTIGHAALKRYQKNRLIEWIAIALTFHYVCFCHLFFSTGYWPTILLLRELGRSFAHAAAALSIHEWQTIAVLVFTVAVFVGVSFTNADAIRRAATWTSLHLTGSTGSLYRCVYLQITIAVLVFYVRWAYQEQPPPVLYMRF